MVAVIQIERLLFGWLVVEAVPDGDRDPDREVAYSCLKAVSDNSDSEIAYLSA